MHGKAGCTKDARDAPNFGWCAALFRKKKWRKILLSCVIFLVHLQGLEPWAHWLRGTQKQFLSISNFTRNHNFIRFYVVLVFLFRCILCTVCTRMHLFSSSPMCKNVQCLMTLEKTGIWPFLLAVNSMHLSPLTVLFSSWFKASSSTSVLRQGLSQEELF